MQYNDLRKINCRSYDATSARHVQRGESGGASYLTNLSYLDASTTFRDTHRPISRLEKRGRRQLAASDQQSGPMGRTEWVFWMYRFQLEVERDEDF